MDTFLVIASKRDQREYADREIPDDVVRKILEAGRIAGSAVNRQPWRFVALEDAELRNRVAENDEEYELWSEDEIIDGN